MDALFQSRAWMLAPAPERSLQVKYNRFIVHASNDIRGAPSSRADKNLNNNSLNNVEMTVADLTLPSSQGSGSSQTRISVPPRAKAAPKELPTQGQKALEAWLEGSTSLMTNPSSLVNNAQLEMAEGKLRQQAIELRQAKLALAQRDEEIKQLQAQALEKDARIRSSRAELIETKAALQEKDAAIQSLYDKLADAGIQRSKLKDELLQTRMELQQTQLELESLADELLSIKDVVLSPEELEELAKAEAEFSAQARASLMQEDDEDHASIVYRFTNSNTDTDDAVEDTLLTRGGGDGATTTSPTAAAAAVDADSTRVTTSPTAAAGGARATTSPATSTTISLTSPLADTPRTALEQNTPTTSILGVASDDSAASNYPVNSKNSTTTTTSSSVNGILHGGTTSIPSMTPRKGSISGSPTPPSYTPVPDMFTEAAQNTWEVLQQLVQLSRQIVQDAEDDEENFTLAGLFNVSSSNSRVIKSKRDDKKKAGSAVEIDEDEYNTDADGKNADNMI